MDCLWSNCGNHFGQNFVFSFWIGPFPIFPTRTFPVSTVRRFLSGVSPCRCDHAFFQGSVLFWDCIVFFHLGSLRLSIVLFEHTLHVCSKYKCRFCQSRYLPSLQDGAFWSVSCNRWMRECMARLRAFVAISISFLFELSHWNGSFCFHSRVLAFVRSRRLRQTTILCCFSELSFAGFSCHQCVIFFQPKLWSGSFVASRDSY